MSRRPGTRLPVMSSCPIRRAHRIQTRTRVLPRSHGRIQLSQNSSRRPPVFLTLPTLQINISVWFFYQICQAKSTLFGIIAVHEALPVVIAPEAEAAGAEAVGFDTPSCLHATARLEDGNSVRGNAVFLNSAVNELVALWVTA
jgi:hypothetical protein